MCFADELAWEPPLVVVAILLQISVLALVVETNLDEIVLDIVHGRDASTFNSVFYTHLPNVPAARVVA